MRTSLLISFLICCSSLSLFAQAPGAVMLHTGAVDMPANLEAFSEAAAVPSTDIIGGRYYRYVQFDQTPDTRMQKSMLTEGLKVLYYVPHATFMMSFPASFDRSRLIDFGARAVMRPTAVQKVSHLLKDESFPDWAVRGNDLELVIQYHDDLPVAAIRSLLEAEGIEKMQKIKNEASFIILLPSDRIYHLAERPYISWIEPISHPGEPEDTGGRSLHRANMLSSSHPMGRHYDGSGINVMVRDDGPIGPHIDFENRTNQTFANSSGTHGDMVAGVFGGAGNLDPTVEGAASGSFFYILDYQSAFTDNTLSLHQTDDVMITNSSYSNGCNAGYTLTTQRVDQQIHQNSSLIHVFSAGNSNSSICGYIPNTSQWGTVTGGHKHGKNVVATANLFADGGLVSSSSWGPASDGRIKPDIAAHGQGQISIDPNNTYAPGGGTSAAAPSSAGVMAQLYQAYREMNGNLYPQSSLIKAIVLNTAEDYGNVGPDFKYGWGRINGYRAVRVLETNQYFQDSVAQGNTKTHTISIPAGVNEARIMVYWMDPEGAVQSARALVNNLDMSISDGSTSWQPLVLDHTPNATNLNAPAQVGVDSLNNVEQVRILNPTAGNYTLSVVGTDIPSGPQPYWVIMDYWTDEITVTYPNGGEGFVPGETERIHWDTYDNSGSFQLSYSEDNGSTWTNITTLPGSSRLFQWTVPNTVTGEALIRVSRAGVIGESDFPFAIIEEVPNITVAGVCPNSVQLIWDPITGAAEYEVYQLLGQKMDSVGQVSGTSICVPIANQSQTHWFAVRPVFTNGSKGRRSVAIEQVPGIFNCLGNDLTSLALNSPTETYYPACLGEDTLLVQFQLVNSGGNNQSGFQLGYQLGTFTPFTTTYTDILAGCTNDLYTFTLPIVLSDYASGTYDLKVWTGLSSDQNLTNDTITQSITIDQSPQILPIAEDFQNNTFPPIPWEVDNPDQGITWTEESVTGANNAPTLAASVNNFSYNSQGQEDRLRTIIYSLDPNNTIAPKLVFDVAYARYDASFSDRMYIELSTNCGQSFDHIIYDKAGTTLATAPDQTTMFFPNAASDWRSDTVDLSAFLGQEVSIRFVNETGYGNRLYLDNINIINEGVIAPNALFATSLAQVCVGETVVLTNASSGTAITYDWDFGPGATPATATTPGPHSVVWSSPGAKTINLTVTNAQGSNSISQIVNVDLVASAGFLPNTSNGYQYSFANTSSGSTNFFWDFGDGNTSTFVAPTHTFGGNGTFTVSLIVSNDCSTDTFSQDVMVSGVLPPTAAFNSSTDQLCAGEDVVFTNQSSGQIITGYDWDFGADANPPTANGPGPYSIAYSTGGTKTVVLAASNGAGTSYDTIIVDVAPLPTAVFQANLQSGQTYDFANNSVDANSYQWDFGDGNQSILATPTHTYTANGTYTVQLIATNDCGADTSEITLNILTVSLDDELTGLSISILPNPNNGQFNLMLAGDVQGELELSIMDVRGRFMQAENVRFGGGNLSHAMQIEPAPAGVYLLRIGFNGKQVYRRLVIQ